MGKLRSYFTDLMHTSGDQTRKQVNMVGAVLSQLCTERGYSTYSQLF